MMSNHNSRRSFLSSLAILSAGSVFSAVPGFVTSADDTALQQLWKAFIRNNSGKRITTHKSLSLEALPAVTKGHIVTTGDHVHFAKEGLIAVPCWIHWNNHSQKPSDLLVTFFSDGIQPAKIIRINRFELEGLTRFLSGKEEQTIKPLLSALKKQDPSSQAFSMKTKITGSRPPETIASIANKPIIFSKNLIYNI